MNRAGDMAQWVTMLPAKPDDMSSVLGTHTMESPQISTYVLCCEHPHAYTYPNKRIVKYNLKFIKLE